MVVLEECTRSELSVSTADTSTLAPIAPFGEPLGPVAVLDAALAAWRECEPDGYVASESVLPTVLEDISRRVPGNRDSRQTLDLLADLFLPSVGKAEVPLFQRMLRARGGQVHFLHFWRAFAETLRLLDNLGCDTSNLDGCSQIGGPNASLVEEVELVRDTILRALDSHAEDADGNATTYADQLLTAKELTELMRETSSMSFAPGFWVSVEQDLCRGRKGKAIDGYRWDDLTVLTMCWLRDAADFQPTEAVVSRRSSTSSLFSIGSTSSRDEGLPVYVHIYDVSHEDNVHKLNKVLAHKRNPFKFGGVFHAGIEVNGLEWAFGMSCSETVPGISCSLPKEHSEHRYRQTVRLRNTKLSAEEVADLIAQLIEEYPGDDYDLLRRNCCHFADDFVRRLGAGRLPSWVHRLARVGAFVDSAMMRIANRSLLPEDDDMF